MTTGGLGGGFTTGGLVGVLTGGLGIGEGVWTGGGGDFY